MNLEELDENLRRMMNKNTEFDHFEPFKRVVPFAFMFSSNRYEVWRDGNLIHSDEKAILINTTLVNSPLLNTPIMQVEVATEVTKRYLTTANNFPVAMTHGDRLLLLHLPVSGENDKIGLQNMRVSLTMMGIMNSLISGFNTQLLSTNQPYACSLFFQSGKIKKITFSVNSPETLIEFYQD